jgi:N-acetylglucosamine kinase-like BadF-type ATPase
MQDIAPLVIESANEGDELCREILDQETNELLLHIMAMKQKLNEEKMKIVFIGGTITTNNSYSKMLKEKIKTFLPGLIIQQTDYPPEIGAVIMAKQN